MPNFADYQSGTLAPGWLRDEWGDAYLRSFGERKDAHVADLKAAIKCRFPRVAERMNLLRYSEDLGNAAWVKSGTASVTTNTEAAPDGSGLVTADTISFPGASDLIYQEITGTYPVGESWTFSVWLKGAQGATCRIHVGVSLGGTEEFATSVITLTPALTRHSVTMPIAIVGHTILNVQIRRGGETATSITAWGAQFERAPSAGRYTPTTSSALTLQENGSPADALALIAAERGLARGTTESEATFRARVRAAWDSWRWAGTAYGLLTAFYWAGYKPTGGKVVLQTQKGKQIELRSDFDPAVHTPENALVTSGLGTVHLGGSPELWSQFAVLFTAPLPPAWVPTPPADGSPEVNVIRSIITTWKPGHMKCVRLRVTTVDLWDYPSETWEPTTELWDEVGVTTDWTPPAT